MYLLDSARNVYLDGAHMLAGDGALANGSCSPNARLDPVYAMHDEVVRPQEGEPYIVRSYISLLRASRYVLHRYVCTIHNSVTYTCTMRLCSCTMTRMHI